MKLRNKKTGGLANIMGEQNFFRVYTDAGWADYNSLAELNADWEDYKPAEPLIEDEKVRKAVRLWAELNGINKLHHYLCDGSSCFIFTDEKDNDCSLDFTFGIVNLISNTDYTITELCGEEEND